jgi:hypothetical protein
VPVIFYAPMPVRQEKKACAAPTCALPAAIFRQVTGADGSPQNDVCRFCGFYRASKRGTRVAMWSLTVSLVSQVSEGEVTCR